MGQSSAGSGAAQSKPRARDLEIPFDGTPGEWNAITDVAGVTVGQVTLISGEGKLQIGVGPVRTGLTAIFPRGREAEPVFAAWHSLNGCGEMTGTIWVEESGLLDGPVMITNTLSVGTVHDAVIRVAVLQFGIELGLPVVAETFDGFLNDVAGFHVREEHVLEAWQKAGGGPVAEGNVGGGTGMICHGFKGGIGTASRRLGEEAGGYTVGVLVQANHGNRKDLTIAGAPVGKEITDLRRETGTLEPVRGGSIIVVVATDAPLLPHQLKRVARRVPLGIGRVGGMGDDGSGDIFLAFSTAWAGRRRGREVVSLQMLPNNRIDPLFEATVQATEEAIVNALVAADTMVGVDGHKVHALPHDRLRDVLRRYNRLNEGCS